MKPEQHDDDSDTEEPHLGFGLRKSDGPQIIHSGHFMVSTPHIEHPPKKGYDFDTVNKQTCQTYHFGKASACHLSIDASLTKLFECMTLAYRRVQRPAQHRTAPHRTHAQHLRTLGGVHKSRAIRRRILSFIHGQEMISQGS